jgi:hypothetical protein
MSQGSWIHYSSTILHFIVRISSFKYKTQQLNMKNTYTLILIFMGMGFMSYAQDINSTSSAESCIAYIDQLAKTSVSGNSWNLTTKFDGTSFTTTETGSGLTFIYESTEINWATFSYLDTRTLKDGNISVSFWFNNQFPRKLTVLDDKSTVDMEFDTRNFFSFNLSPSQETKIKDLETAAKRLVEIAKKGDPKFAVKAGKQPKEGNPSYEETVTYIKTYFDKPSMEGNDSYLSTLLV